MNGNQMLLLAWWEFAAVLGLFILAYIFLPIYYRNNCTTTTELLQKKYNDKHIRALISVLFLFGNLFIFLPAILYGGSLFLLSMTDAQIPMIAVAITFAVVGAAYAILGGLRAVAVSDTYSGVLILGLALLVVYLSMRAIDFDFSGIVNVGRSSFQRTLHDPETLCFHLRSSPAVAHALHDVIVNHDLQRFRRVDWQRCRVFFGCGWGCDTNRREHSSQIRNEAGCFITVSKTGKSRRSFQYRLAFADRLTGRLRGLV